MNEKWSISTLSQEFTLAQMDRIVEKAEQGYLGWDSEAMCTFMRAKLATKANGAMEGHAMSKDYVDIANLAMFLYAHAMVDELRAEERDA